MPESSVVFINTGPLVAFSRSDNMQLLQSLPMSFVVTNQVAEELASGTRSGRKEVDLSAFERRTVKIIRVGLIESLDLGEASVIQGALDHGDAWVAIDERLGRDMALQLGLRLRGTLGLLLEAKKSGLIDRIGPEVLKMRAMGTWFSDAMIADALKTANEEPEIAGADDES